VSDVVSDAEMVRGMLCAEFRNVVVATALKPVVNDFDRYQPEILIWVFSTLEKTQAYDLEFFSLSKLAPGLPHRTVILCCNEEMLAAYDLCRQERFYDYVLFWPLVHDASRLSMAVTNALRDLQHSKGAVTAVQTGSRSAVRTGVDIQAAIDSFAKKIIGGVLAAAVVSSKRAEHFQPLVLVVDDSEFERKLMGKLLEETFYELAFAASGVEAFSLLRKKRPDLILMDLDMPVLNGLDILRQLKATTQFADIPVMMVTGMSGKGIVVDCLQAGAVDFVVKPLERVALLKKLDRFLS